MPWIYSDRMLSPGIGGCKVADQQESTSSVENRIEWVRIDRNYARRIVGIFHEYVTDYPSVVFVFHIEIIAVLQLPNRIHFRIINPFKRFHKGGQMNFSCCLSCGTQLPVHFCKVIKEYYIQSLSQKSQNLFIVTRWL